MAKRKKIMDKEKEQILEEFRSGQYNVGTISNKYGLALVSVRKVFKQFLFLEVREKMIKDLPRMDRRISVGVL